MAGRAARRGSMAHRQMRQREQGAMGAPRRLSGARCHAPRDASRGAPRNIGAGGARAPPRALPGARRRVGLDDDEPMPRDDMRGPCFHLASIRPSRWPATILSRQKSAPMLDARRRPGRAHMPQQQPLDDFRFSSRKRRLRRRAQMPCAFTMLQHRSARAAHAHDSRFLHFSYALSVRQINDAMMTGNVAKFNFFYKYCHCIDTFSPEAAVCRFTRLINAASHKYIFWRTAFSCGGVIRPIYHLSQRRRKDICIAD